MSLSAARVRDVTTTGPFRRVVFEVDSPAGLALPGLPDECVGVYLPENDHPRPDAAATTGRTYSVRAVDPDSATLTIDFVIHPQGPATRWAAHARPGATVTLAHANGWFRPPADTEWLLLAADLTGMPALARIIETASPEVRPVVVVEVGDPTQAAYLPPLDLEPIVVVGGNGHGPSRLAETVRGLPLPTGTGYLWFAGEAAASRSVRRYVRGEHHWAHGRYAITGYWRADAEDWDRRFAPHGPRLYERYQRAIDSGITQEQAAEDFDDALDDLGL